MIMVDKSVNTTVWIGGCSRTVATGADADPTSATVEIWPMNSATQTVTGASLSKFDSQTGYYGYAWDISSVAVGVYQFRITWVIGGVNISTSGYVGVTSGTFTITTPPTAAAVADAVWNETATDHTTAGSTGALLADIQDDIGLGNGSATHSLHFENQNGVAKAGLQVWLTTDAAGAVLFTSKNNRTNSGGNITFNVALNTAYYVWTSESSTYAGSFTKTS